MFDPISYMKRYFDEDASHHLALVDEAHNLIDRSRDMYSASISYAKYKEAKRSVAHSKLLKLKRAQTKINKMFKDIEDIFADGDTIVEEYPEELKKVLDYFVDTCLDINKNNHKEMTKELLDFYLDVNEFVKLCEYYCDKFIFYISKTQYDLTINLYCMDASAYIAKSLKKVKGATLFSATLQPINYYIDTLGGDKAEDPRLILPSPFPIDNLKILVAPKVSVKYKNREKSYMEVAGYIESFIKNKVGNYFIYSPSYEYMEQILAYLTLDEYDYYVQTKDMDEVERETFLLNFQTNPQKTTLGFLVLGGAFSEGVDLVSDRLIGAVIIGIGMPRINFQSDCISQYYKDKDLPGFDYAYLNPGMNKIMQAVGRVIRSEEDRGAVLLIDERYMSHQYQDLFREEWKNYEVVLSPNEVETIISKFFNN